MCRITNFAVVEVTPIGTENPGWKFWIAWTVTNSVLLALLYLFYTETGEFARDTRCRVSIMHSHESAANRSLEDMDAYYRSNPSLIVINDQIVSTRS